jgi:hypothetical protein
MDRMDLEHLEHRRHLESLEHLDPRPNLADLKRRRDHCCLVDRLDPLGQLDLGYLVYLEYLDTWFTASASAAVSASSTRDTWFTIVKFWLWSSKVGWKFKSVISARNTWWTWWTWKIST